MGKVAVVQSQNCGFDPNSFLLHLDMPLGKALNFKVLTNLQIVLCDCILVIMGSKKHFKWLLRLENLYEFSPFPFMYVYCLSLF